MGKNVLLTVLLIALLAAGGYCSSNQCPQEEDMPDGCSCTKGSYSFSGLEVKCFGNGKNPKTIKETAALLKHIFPAKTTTLQLLQFDYFRKPNNLYSRIFEGLRIKELHIEFSKIVDWSDMFGGPAFVGLENSLEELHIIGSIFASENYGGETDRPAPLSLGHLQRLTTVKISENKLYVFDKDWFGIGRSSVTKLDISRNEIHVMGKEALVGLSKLEQLNAAHNKLEGFPEGIFNNSLSLKQLELEYNPIMFLSENVFGKLWSQLNLFSLFDSHLHCGDHINWMVNVRPPRNFVVRCEVPESELLKEVLKRKILERAQKKVLGLKISSQK